VDVSQRHLTPDASQWPTLRWPGLTPPPGWQ
jgi:hypothetical protein